MNKDLLYRFFGADTTVEEKRKVRSWVEESADNRREFIKQRHIFDAMFFASTSDESRIETARRRSRRRNVVVSSFLCAAAALAAVLILETPATDNEKGLLLENNLTVTEGGNNLFELCDGTKVWLNSGSSLEYGPDFGRKSRTVTLRGEAYFEVAHNESLPMVIHTFAGDVCVRGTSFNLIAVEQSGLFETALIEGSVIFSPADESAEDISLTPGEKLYLSDTGLVKEDIRNYDEYLWREGILSIDNLSFKRMVDRVERFFCIDIIVENNMKVSGDELSFTTRFYKNDGADYAMRILSKSIPFNYTHTDNTNQYIIK